MELPNTIMSVTIRLRYILLLTYLLLFDLVILAQTSCYESRLQYAKKSYQEGKYKDAIEKFKTAKLCSDAKLGEIDGWIVKAKEKLKPKAGQIPDRDEDGFSDNEDSCPDSYGSDFNGCPENLISGWASKSVSEGTYTGYFLNGKRNGYGTFTYYQFNREYIGYWRNDLKEGEGIYTVKNGFIANCPECVKYIGEWEKDQKNGFGRCFNSNDELIYEGSFSSDKPLAIYPSSFYKPKSQANEDMPGEASRQENQSVQRVEINEKIVKLESEILSRTGIEMKYITGGAFEMGSKEGWEDNAPIHNVTLRPFLIGKFEVTQKQWMAVMKKNPVKYDYLKGENCAVTNITWGEVQKFIEVLNKETGLSFRLPTEAEWEYAARGGETFRFAGSDEENMVAPLRETGGYIVGRSIPNGFGIFDMTGNVGEMCADFYSTTYYSNSPPANPLNTISNGFKKKFDTRVLRGFDHRNYEWLKPGNVLAPVYARNPYYHDNSSISTGFRLVLTVEE